MPAPELVQPFGGLLSASGESSRAAAALLVGDLWRYQVKTKLQKTIRPLAPAEVCRWRTICAGFLAHEGLTARGIRQVLGLSGPDQARRYVAKAHRKFAQ